MTIIRLDEILHRLDSMRDLVLALRESMERNQKAPTPPSLPPRPAP